MRAFTPQILPAQSSGDRLVPTEALGQRPLISPRPCRLPNTSKYNKVEVLVIKSTTPYLALGHPPSLMSCRRPHHQGPCRPTWVGLGQQRTASHHLQVKMNMTYIPTVTPWKHAPGPRTCTAYMDARPDLPRSKAPKPPSPIPEAALALTVLRDATAGDREGKVMDCRALPTELELLAAAFEANSAPAATAAAIPPLGGGAELDTR